MVNLKLKKNNMPWEIIVVPVILCLVWGFKNGVKTKSDSGYKRPSNFW